MSEPTYLLIRHQELLSQRVDSLEKQIEELRVSWWQRRIKRLIISARAHRVLTERATDWLFRRVKWLRSA